MLWGFSEDDTRAPDCNELWREATMVTVTEFGVEFRFLRPGAREACVIGDFNGWQCGQLPMERLPDGFWQARVRLPEGCFRFHYFVDGQCYTDFAAFGVEFASYGPVGVVYVPPNPKGEQFRPAIRHEEKRCAATHG
jgi:1,4-alpha-glucan branching enzyme